MNTETLINATSIKAVNVGKVKTLLNLYLMHLEDIEDYTREISELEKRQSKTALDLSGEIEMAKCHRAIEEVKIRKVKISLSLEGILIDD